MQIHQQVLLELLSHQEPLISKKDISSFSTSSSEKLVNLEATDLANLYANIGFYRTFLVFLLEQHWLHQKSQPGEESSYVEFVTPFLQQEFLIMSFMHEHIRNSMLSEMKSFILKAEAIEKLIIKIIKNRNFEEQKQFSIEALQLISELFEFENQLSLSKKMRGQHLALSLYRTFDGLDQIFNLDYLADQGMKTDLANTERLYEGAGVGVQSGYSTVLTALRYLTPRANSRFIDLGSGYGRLGLVIGLLRPDIDFIGYEYVQHRVDLSNAAAANLTMQKHVHFYTQDLSDKQFKIPEAEIYYLYDPFSKETYSHVLGQLVEISRRKKISIATKGNAREWLMAISKNENWPSPQEFDNGNLCLFQN